MEFKPRYPQPFTIAQAIEFDVSVITEEIARLQNSITHLKGTQQLIQTHLETEGDDAELAAVLRENEEVIASQQERISMLQFVLRERGITGIEHYTLPAPNSSVTSRAQSSQLTFDNNISEDGGIDL